MPALLLWLTPRALAAPSPTLSKRVRTQFVAHTDTHTNCSACSVPGPLRAAHSTCQRATREFRLFAVHKRKPLPLVYPNGTRQMMHRQPLQDSPPSIHTTPGYTVPVHSNDTSDTKCGIMVSNGSWPSIYWDFYGLAQALPCRSHGPLFDHLLWTWA